jgi:hypothetical protein
MRRVLPLFVVALLAACAERSKPEEAPTPPPESANAAPLAVTSVTDVPKAPAGKLSLKRIESARNIRVAMPPASVQGAPTAASPVPPADAATGG